MRPGLPRVLYIVSMDPRLKFGSMEEQIACLARAFRENGSLFLPLFICSEPGGGHFAFREMGIDFACMDLRTFHWRGLVQLSRLIVQRQITVAHWNFTEPLRNAYLWLLTFLHPRLRHCYTDHISRMSGEPVTCGAPKRLVKRLLLRRYERVFSVSQFILDDLQNGQICSNLQLSRHFVNTRRFQPNPRMREKVRKQFHAENRFVVLTVAQLIRAKGIDALIRAMAQLPEEVVLWIVGEGEELSSLQQLCSALDLTRRVHFMGLQHNVAPFMQAADCFVCPSVWAEAAGLVNLEAGACGLPVIASRIGGLPESVEDGYTGFLFSPGNHEELARHIQVLIENSVLRSQMSLASRTRAVETFSADVGVPRYLELYRGLGRAVC